MTTREKCWSMGGPHFIPKTCVPPPQDVLTLGVTDVCPVGQGPVEEESWA